VTEHHGNKRPNAIPGPLHGRQINPLSLPGNEMVADLIDNVYARSGFNGRRLAEAAQLFTRMIRDDATIAVTISGAMTPIGMSGPIIELMQRGFVDFIITTGANIFHDIHQAFSQPVIQGHFAVDDNELALQGVSRIYDVFIGEVETLMATDDLVIDVCRSIDLSGSISTADLHWRLGGELAKRSPYPERSFLIQAHRLDVPVFTSSPGDSGIGMDLIVPHLQGQRIGINPLRDVVETAAIVRAAKKNGVVEVGGGSPKNFYMQTQPVLSQILYDPEAKGGHDYFIQLTADAPHWGGLSGATPSEARSWGKIKDAAIDNVVVYSCASITFPLLVQYVLCRNTPRDPKRIYGHLSELSKPIHELAMRRGLRTIADIEPAMDSA
jgi:deoxyhypusine synthase